MYCYSPHFTHVVTETQGWSSLPTELTQASQTAEPGAYTQYRRQLGVAGAWLSPEGTGQRVLPYGADTPSLRVPGPYLFQPCRLARAAIQLSAVACPSVGSGSFPGLHSRICSEVMEPFPPLCLEQRGHCCARRKTPIDQGLPGVLPFFPACLRGQETLWWGWRDVKVTPGCLREDCPNKSLTEK